MAINSSVVSRRSSWSKGLTAATDRRVAQMASSKTGKPNWARGLTAATDPRIAQNAETRRGKKRGAYRRADRTPRVSRSVVVDAREVLEEYQDADYVYLLGMYLGDGCLARFPGTYRLETSSTPSIRT